MNITNQISESLETIFWVKYLNSLMRMWIQIFDPVSWIRDEKNFNNAESAYIIWPLNFVFAKFDGASKSSEFHADSKTVEENAKNY